MQRGLFRWVYLLLAGLAASFALPDFAAARPREQTIRNISIEVREMFDDPDIGTFYRAANGLKISTKEEVVRRELLFNTGDKYDEFVLEESERALRALSFIRQVSITPIPDGEFVDILVSVQDTWTIFPQLGFSSGGGTQKLEIGLLEKNLLGWGKSVELAYLDDEGRETFRGIWDDRRVFGTYHRFTFGQLLRADGYRTVSLFGRPFRSLLDTSSWSASVDASDLVHRLFANASERYIFRDKAQDISARYVISRGDPEKLLHRYSGGYAYINDDFTVADEQDFEDANVSPCCVSNDPSMLPEDRRFSGPFFVYDRIVPDFISINYIDRFERIEDYNLGNVTSLRAQVAPEIFGSYDDTLLVTASSRQGLAFSPTAFLRGELGAASRLDNDGFENTILRGEMRYYNVLGNILPQFFVGKHTLAVNLQMDYGNDLDLDREFLLGAANGLRGYKDRTFTGDKRVVLNLEDRFHIAEDVLRLFSLGGVVFTDVGGSTFDSYGTLFGDEMYSDIGFGLRIGVPRTAGGGVVRFDIAFPLRDGPDGSEQFNPRFFITTGQLFSSLLRSETVGAERANVTLGEAD
ncbi:MAG: BamA/TamA family outer membrane protein [Bdellovibrionales bacterium]|nr:BamA/TamA family outer membrane protein [Bdellovibrionales bacterium]